MHKDNNMKLEEVVLHKGVSNFVRPGTMINQQVVQPRTLQADGPEQSGQGYEKAKSKQKEWHRIEVDVYNNRDVDQIEDPYDNPEELEKKLNKTIFSIDNEVISKFNDGYEEFAKKIKGEIDASEE